MTIHDEQAKAKQDQQRAERRENEREARPNLTHRVLLFLLKAVTENNPDLRVEAEHHMRALDRELTTNPEKLEELEAPPAAPVVPPARDTQAAPPAVDTAAQVRQSRRFKRNQQ